ncbi:serine hydrolase domain-containing protein [Geodermatophilus sp. SYSU D00691]
MTQVSQAEMKSWVGEILNRWPSVGLAFGVVRDGSLEFFSAHGLADIETRTPIAEDTVFRIGSITKTFTAVAAMQLVERGLVDLDAPADEYLRAYRLVPADPDWRPATVRHLLTHTAGIGEQVPRAAALRRDFGVTVPMGRPVPTLAEHYRGHVPLDTEPGTRFRYTDHGPATVGQIVEDVTGVPLDRYLREHVFLPLGMTSTDLLRSEIVRPRVATGYVLRAHGPRAVTERQFLTAAAGSAYSTPRDMARYLQALLGGGGNEHGSVLEPATLAGMFEAQYRPDPRLAGVGLAFLRGDAGGHLTVEHQGTLPGFKSQIFLAPDDRIGVMAFSNGTIRGETWLPVETSRLLSELIGAPPAAVRGDVPQHPEVWGELCGRYPVAVPLSDVRIKAFLGAGFEVLVRGGRLHLRFLSPIPPLYRGFALHPDDETDPYAFRIEFGGLGMATIPMQVVFGRDPDSGTVTVHVDLQSVSAEKQPARTHPGRWITGALIRPAAAVAGSRHRGVHRSQDASQTVAVVPGTEPRGSREPEPAEHR